VGAFSVWHHGGVKRESKDSIDDMKVGIGPKKGYAASDCDDLSRDRTYSPVKYNFSFIGASLRPELARIVAESYLDAGDWSVVKERILSSNALQSRSASSAVRMERELRQRVQTLTHDQIVILAQGIAEDRAAMTWLGALKHVVFAFEFATDVLREKLATQDPILRHSDYESFVESKSVSHPELAQLANSSKNKIRQILLLMLVEANLLRGGIALGTIQRPLLSPRVHGAITSDSSRWLAGFLVPDAEIGIN
jgi:hypothetical protein